MCCEQVTADAGPDYATEVWNGPAQNALPDSTISPVGTLAAFDTVCPQYVGYHDFEVSTSTQSAGQYRNQPRQEGRGRSSASAKRRGRHKQHDAGGRLAQDNPSPDKRQDRQDTGRLSIVTGPVHMEVGTLVDQIAQVNAGMMVAKVTPSEQGLSMCLPHIFIIVFPTVW